MQAMEEEGKTPARTPKFWKAILEYMDRTQMHDQCRDKWKAKDGGRIWWRKTDTKTLVMVSHSHIYTNHLTRVTLLNIDTEEDVNWD